MDDENPFDPPSATPTQASNSGRSIFVVISSLVGGLVGLVIGVMGIAVMSIFMGTPGMLEILILLVGISIILVIPCAFVGAIFGSALNSRSKT